MNFKITTGISIGILFVAFATVSLLVILTGRHPYFVAKKLRLGALILSLSGASAGCFATSCYVQAPPNNFTIDHPHLSNDSITISKTSSDTISGKITLRDGNTFSYAIFDSSGTLIVKDNIFPIDGSFDEDSEEFNIIPPPSIMPGIYELRFYSAPEDSIQNTDWYAGAFPLKVIE